MNKNTYILVHMKATEEWHNQMLVYLDHLVILEPRITECSLTTA